MKLLHVFLLVLLMITINSCGQSNSRQNNKETFQTKVGGSCEGCEAIYEQAPSFESLSWIDTLPDFNEPGTKLIISGVIYKDDGITPAPGIILYVYHTDQTGHYTSSKGQTGWARRHGYIRGWMKTNEKGEYKFYTLMPGHYPGTNAPAHIHPIIKEPDKSEYYIDEYLFDDDKFLTTSERKKSENRGGNGILTLEERDGMFFAERNIYLGRNIPGYPLKKITELQSGLELGDHCPAFDPLHLSGADAGKIVCPMCKYGYGRGIMLWFNNTNIDTLRYFAKNLEEEMENMGENKLRVFIIYMNPTYNINDAGGEIILQSKLKKWCEEQGLKKVALVWVPSPLDEESCGLFIINSKAENTVFVYKKRKIAAKWVNIDYSDQVLKKILQNFD
ncbi:MAG: hypothetical protein JST17_10760 [Bacteroidetes bacterium]|nr:hypothetical protein [Bacteroidota bacterium]MBS1930376.1 hypothetical protein [Bacteroidota bacterium]